MVVLDFLLHFTLTVRPVPNVTLPSNQTYVNGAIVPTQTFTSTLSSAIYSWTNSNTSIGIPAEGTGNIGSFTAINITPTIQTATITVTPKNYLSYTIYKTHAGTGSLSQYGQAPQNAIEFENMFNTSNSNTTVWATGSANPLNILDWTSTTQLNNNGISTPGSNYFGIKVVGTFIPVETGVYTFQLQGDDAYDLFVNGSLVVSQYGGYSAVPHTGTISLTAGMQYTLVARQQEFAGGEGLIVRWKRPSQSVYSTQPEEFLCCDGISQSYTITVNPTPTVNAVANQSFCAGSLTSLVTFASTFNVSGTTYSWTNSNTDIGLASSGTGDIPSFVATNTLNTPISAIITVTPSANGVNGSPVSFVITVRPTPNVILPSDQSYVIGDLVPTQIFTSFLPNVMYNWTNSNTTIGIPAQGTGNIVSFTATNTYFSGPNSNNNGYS